MGTILTWSRFEGSTLNGIDAELAAFGASDAELTSWIATAISNQRMVDMCKWCADYYYHPSMHGRTSIKVVMDALWKSDRAMRDQFKTWTSLDVDTTSDPYTALPPIEIKGIPQDVREGTGAMRAYEAMIYGVDRDDFVVRDQWATLLKQYCKLDSLSMVLILESWRRVAEHSEN
jgi:hypothetical protein